MNPYIEILGTFSSVVVAISLTMKNLRWLRTVNLVGALFFSVYGLLIQSWPVFGLNAFIVVINTYYLVQLARQKDNFSLLEVKFPESDALLGQFLAHHSQDILRFQPEFTAEDLKGSRVIFLLREVLPVSLFVCRKEGDTQRILLDYAIPAWRDFQTARFFFNEGVRELDWEKNGKFVAETRVKAHEAYLKRVGFVRTSENGRPLWVRGWGDQ
ncbi:MAG: hypothetical protein WCG80_01395 [Spirochaetales bacterium]